MVKPRMLWLCGMHLHSIISGVFNYNETIAPFGEIVAPEQTKFTK